MTPAVPRTLEVRHLQLARALLAALAAIMITFSADHSAAVGLAVFSGFAIASALVLLLAAWLVYPAGSRGPALVLGGLSLVAGMVSGIPPLRTTTLFFVIVIAWAVLAGTAELVSGLRARRHHDPAARDAILIGAVTLALALGLLLVNPAYSLEYVIRDAASGGRTFTLTGITIGVGLFGGYAAIVAVFLGIAGFSPRRTPVAPSTAVDAASPRPAGSAPTPPAGETA